MTHTTKIVLVGSLLCASACKTISKKDMLVNSASLKAEPQEVWNRPTEVGFTMGKTIEASSDTSKLLMIIHAGGDPIKSSISIPTFGASAPSLSSNARWAIARAVEEAGADGMYITKVVEEKSVIFPVWTSSATVTGKALTLKDFGPVHTSRADLDRFGHAPQAKGTYTSAPAPAPAAAAPSAD